MRPLLEHSITVDAISRMVHGETCLEPTLTFTGVSSSDSEVIEGDLFLAYPGKTTHGAQFAAKAIAKGARAILTDSQGAKIASNVPTIVVADARIAGAVVSASLYGKPMQEMVSIGITGTNGKTTVSTLLYQLFEKAGRECGLIGTVETRIGRESIPSARTTPEADELQALAATMSERHLRHLVMEVSSHAMVMKRMVGSHFSIVGFTNLTQDHLDFHHDMESYFAAKASLFTLEYADRAFINIDDPYGMRLFNQCPIPAVSLSRQNTKATWHYTSITPDSSGTSFSLRGSGGILIESTTPLRGDFNLDNLLLTFAIAVECGIDPLDCAAIAPHLYGAPGRMETIDRGQNFAALVDYAHTPDAVSSALSTARKFTTGKVIAILGCGGDRDSSKRPLMGKALLGGSDIAIFTSDNPRSEDPKKILDDMTGPLVIAEPSKIIIDRKSAIEYAVSLCDAGDTLLLLGKGHEKGQEILGRKIDFDDRIVLAEALEALR
ncbi:MAG: UDP-N-acetylmuramoyl-L-alanyl-D-glutamate--2,6-diaminopimelate ligase [Candidatus Planktophila sp.]